MDGRRRGAEVDMEAEVLDGVADRLKSGWSSSTSRSRRWLPPPPPSPASSPPPVATSTLFPASKTVRSGLARARASFRKVGSALKEPCDATS